MRYCKSDIESIINLYRCKGDCFKARITCPCIINSHSYTCTKNNIFNRVKEIVNTYPEIFMEYLL